MAEPLTAMPWFGGKSVSQPASPGRWVLSLLPPLQRHQTYVEPYAGMLSLLLARGKADNEVANDLDSRVADFWRVLRDFPELLERQLAATECGVEVWREARAVLLAGTAAPVIDRVWAFVVATAQSSMSVPSAGWKKRRNYAPKEQDRGKLGTGRVWADTKRRITAAPLIERIREVVIENREGAEVAAYYGLNPRAVIYCDPPYSAGAYGYCAKADLNALAEAVADLPSKVAISGYPDDPYDQLQWRRYQRPITARPFGKDGAPRVECLWANYDADPQGVLL